MPSRGPISAAHAAAISRGQRARLGALAEERRVVTLDEPTQSGRCVDIGCGWHVDGLARTVRTASREHVRTTAHVVVLTQTKRMVQVAGRGAIPEPAGV